MATTLTDTDSVSRRLIAQMLAEGTSSAPIQHWTQGLNRLAQAAIGGMNMAALRNQEKVKQADDASLFLSAPGLPGTAPLAPPMPPGMPAPAVSGTMIPGANGEPARPKVASTARVFGDDEAIAAGLYDAPKPTGIAPPATPQPSPVAQAFSVMPGRSGPQIPHDVGIHIQRLLRNPSTRSQGLALYNQFVKPQTPKWEKLDETTLYDQGTGRTMPVGSGYRPLTDPAERARYGIPESDPRPYQVGPAGKLINPPPETRVNIDQRGEGKFTEVAAGKVAERLNKYVEAGDEAVNAKADLDFLREIGSRITTGKSAEFKAAIGPYAEMLGLKVEGLSDLQAFDAIVSRAVPRLRPPGSGTTSDFDMKLYLKSWASLGKTPEGNAIIMNTNQALMEHRLAVADIASRALAGEMTAREAEKQIRALPDPLKMWKQSRGKSPAASPDDLRRKYGLEPK